MSSLTLPLLRTGINRQMTCFFFFFLYTFSEKSCALKKSLKSIFVEFLAGNSNISNSLVFLNRTEATNDVTEAQVFVF